MAIVWRELGMAARRLRRAPGFTAAAVATLGLGLGVNLAIFSGLYAALWQPLPYPQAGRLVRFSGAVGPYHDVQILPYLAQALTAPENPAMNAVGLFGKRQAVVTGLGPAQQVDELVVSPELFGALGLAPERGRGLAAADARPGAQPVALVSDAFWRTQLQAAALTGLSLNLDGVPHTVVGLLPPGFLAFDQDYGKVLAPLDAKNEATVALWAVGRLRPGVEVAAARAEASSRALRARPAAGRPRESLEVLDLGGWLHGRLGGVPWYLLGAAGLILLLACVNTASLLLARIGGRRREFAIRQALGASRRRLLAQVMSEALLLALGGGVAAWALAWGLLRGLAVMHPPQWLASGGLGSPARVGFAIAVSLVAGLACSVAPAWRAARRPPQAHEMTPRRLRGGVIAFETALALVLAVAVALLLRTVARLEAVPLGFDPAGVLTADFVLPPARYKSDAAKQEFFSRLLERVQAMPGVAGAALASPLPFGGETMAVASVNGRKRSVMVSSTTPDFFRTFGVAVAAGRALQATDRSGTPRVAMVNQALAQAWWPGQNPIGQQLAMSFQGQPGPWTVVGVVKDFHWFSLDEALAPAAFFPRAQLPLPGDAGLVLRTGGDLGAAGWALKRAVTELDPDVVVTSNPMTRVARSDLRRPQFYLALLAVAGGLALALAAVGVYGTVSYWVGERRQEMGVRLALGARPGQVERQVLARTLRWAAVGALVGAGGAVAAGRALGRLLFEVKPSDPASIASGAALLLAVAAAAAWSPARRAGRVDPVAALRQE